MQLTNSFSVPGSPDDVWPVLLDVERVAPCLPGATLTEVVDDSTFKGRASVKVGPVNLTFDGVATLHDVDMEARTARIVAKGNDPKGRGAAEAEARFSLEPENGGSRVTVVTDLALTGPVAQYGRASGLMQEIANQLIGQFARNLEAELAKDAADASRVSPNGEPDAPREGASAARSGQEGSISGISLVVSSLWAMLRRWVSGLFGRRGQR